MKYFQRIAANIDVTPLLLAIKQNPHLWKEDTYLRDYPQGPFGEVETIMLRFPVKSVKETEQEVLDHLSKYDQHESIDYPAYAILTQARPLVMNLMAYVHGTRLGRVMINKIAPGGKIFPHVDTPEHTKYFRRFHLVLESYPGVVFRAGDEQINPQSGEIFWFDNSQEHEVINNSADNRTSMVIDIKC